MFKAYDASGDPFIVDAEHWRAGNEGVTFSDSRGSVVATYGWNEISDMDIEKING